MIPWIRIFLYFSILALIIVRVKKKGVPLSSAEAIAAFALKVILACLYGYVHLRFYNGDDTWLYHTEGIEEYNVLKRDPLRFITDFWPAHVHSVQTLKDFIFRSLEHDIMVKLMGVFSFFSRGNYYVNTVFFNFILFWGHYWLFSFLIKQYPEKRIALLISIFFIPTIVFWLSGIRGDGLVFFFLSLLFIQFNNWLNLNRIRFLIYSLLCLLGIFIFRNAIVLVLIPFLTGWYISKRFNKKPLPTYVLTYLAFTLLFFGSGLIHRSINLPEIVVEKQLQFMELPGKTRFEMKPLTADLPAFLKALPPAMQNTLLRPYIWEAKGLLQVATAVETSAYLLCIVIILLLFDWSRIRDNAWVTGILFFSVTVFLFIGLTIPFPGAIIRYKAIPELLLIVSLLLAARRIKIS